MGIHADDDFSLRLARTPEGRDGVADNLIEVRHLPGRIVVLRVSADAVDDFIGAFSLSEDFPEREGKCLLVELPLLRAPAEAPCEIDDGGEGLLQFVRNDGRHLADDPGAR